MKYAKLLGLPKPICVICFSRRGLNERVLFRQFVPASTQIFRVLALSGWWRAVLMYLMQFFEACLCQRAVEMGVLE